MDLSDHIPARRLYAWYRFCPNWQVVAFLRAMLSVFEGGIATGAAFCWALGIYATNFIGDQVMFYSVRTVGSDSLHLAWHKRPVLVGRWVDA